MSIKKNSSVLSYLRDSSHTPLRTRNTMSDTKPVIVADPTKGVKLNASDVAKPFREEIKAKVEAMKAAGQGR